MSGDAFHLTPGGARALHLHAQGFLAGRRQRATKGDVLTAIERMQLLQIDTISVVARSPYLVLFSRLGDYAPTWLDELLAEGAIHETWAHEACFAPMTDFALLRAHLSHKSHHWALRHAARQHRENPAGMQQVLARIRDEGPLRSSDFEASARAGGWWGWKDEKRWLEAWFGLGELMVARRENFQRVYDLTDRVLTRASVAPDVMPSIEPAWIRSTLVERSVRALGIARAEWIADYYRLRPRVRDEELAPLVASGRLALVQVAGWPAPAYVHADHRIALQRAAEGRLRPTLTTLLSPFDPVVWDRERAQALFGFEYRLECYVPAPRRQFGYFVLPILHRGRLIGRLDAKAHRRERLFEIKSLYFEPGLGIDDTMLDAVAQAIIRCATWHGAGAVSSGSIEPRSAGKPFKAALRTAWARLRKS